MNREFYKKLTKKKDISQTLEIHQKLRSEKKLSRNLTFKDLTSFGIAAIIGAGIFSTIGNASAAGGPAVSLLFVFTAIACLFSALCYAEFASGIPLAGSAYTYAYVSFGEFVAWIIGWDLIMEYAIGNIAVAISWSDYFTNLMKGIGINIPHWLSMDYLSAINGYESVVQKLEAGVLWENLLLTERAAYMAWTSAPQISGTPLIADVPALLIVILITTLVYTGIKETKRTANLMVVFKLGIILMVIIVGAFYVNPDNWSPFAPEGLRGVLSGVSAVFFAYIGFDAISTTAEESKNPQRDLPLSMIVSLIICTALYVTISFVLTGMVNYKELGVGDPLAFVFDKVGLSFISGIVAFGAIIAMTGVLLVFQMGQPRIWMSMSRDGLLPPVFSKIHPRFHTPSFATIVTGLIVAIPALFMNLTQVTDLTSIGTLFAFAVVCGGVLVRKAAPKKDQFKIPYLNSRVFIPIFLATFLLLLALWPDIFYPDHYINAFLAPVDNLLHIFFILFATALSITAVYKKLSLIPVLGLIINVYLMSELGLDNWIRFLVWLAAGLVVYSLYGFRRRTT
ncbi:amino acid permease [Cytophagaceae bacterium ABcell3]|nr:amino acid permease [Cytophagaceae bacterium ABcell3]